MGSKNYETKELSLPTAMVNEIIRKERLKKGYTQAYMAHALGITEKAYRNIESGTTQNLALKRIEEIANVLEINWLELLQQKERIIQINGDNNTNQNNQNNQNQYITLYPSETSLAHENEKQAQEIVFLKKEIDFLKSEIQNLKEINALLKNKKE